MFKTSCTTTNAERQLQKQGLSFHYLAVNVMPWFSGAGFLSATRVAFIAEVSFVETPQGAENRELGTIESPLRTRRR